MTETLQEYCDSRGVQMRVDREEGVIRGVKILGLQSRNGRSYLPEALVQAARLYEDAKVNVNHPKGNPAAPRDYQDRMGMIRNVNARQGEGLFADFYFNPKHVLAEQLIWDAEHAPQNVGFSHNVEARTTRRGDQVIVEAITRVQSVDLVADPASTRSLFEFAGGENNVSSVENTQILTVEDLKNDHPQLVEQLCRELLDEQQRLQAEVERLTAIETAHQKRQIVRQLLQEFNLPDPDSNNPKDKIIVSEQFLELLLAEEDEKVMRELIEERARVVQALEGVEPVQSKIGDQRQPNQNCEQGLFSKASGRPCSRDQHMTHANTRDVKAFVEAIT